MEAESEEEAKDKVNNCEGLIDEGSFEYSHMLDKKFWTVEKDTSTMLTKEEADNLRTDLKDSYKEFEQ